MTIYQYRMPEVLCERHELGGPLNVKVHGGVDHGTQDSPLHQLPTPPTREEVPIENMVVIE